MRAVSLSQKGSKSEKNEDACLVLAAKQLFVLADGVGGGPSGDYASRTLVEQLYEDCSEAKSLTEELILNSIKTANNLIVQTAQQSERIGMASTIACAFAHDGALTTIHVGDSRVYRLRDGALNRLTRDHVKTIEKQDGSLKQVVTNAIGVRADLKVEVQNFDWNPDDAFILCSDGITDVLNDSALLEMLSDQRLSIIDRLKRILTEAESQGGRDDKTIIYAFSPQ